MKKPKINPETPDRQNPEWSQADFARAKRVWEIPALAHLSQRKPGERGPQKSPTKQQVTLRLDREVLQRFRATGVGWQGRINEALKKARV